MHEDRLQVSFGGSKRARWRLFFARLRILVAQRIPQGRNFDGSDNSWLPDELGKE